MPHRTILACLFLLLLPSGHAMAAPGIPTQGPGDRPLVVGLDRDYPPYSFADARGEPAGFDVALVRLLATRAGFTPRFHLMAWGEALDGLAGGKTDLLAGVIFLESRNTRFDFTIPVRLIHYALFHRKDIAPPDSSHLQGSRMVALRGDASIPRFLEPMGLLPEALLVDTTSEAFQAIERGERDYVLAPHATGLELIRKLGLRNIVETHSPVLPSLVCFAVRKGDAELLAALNQAIDAAKQDGSLDRLVREYLEPLDPEKPLPALPPALRVALFSLGALGLLALAWTWTLRSRVRLATAGLRESEARLAASEARFRALFNTMTAGFAVHEMLHDDVGRPCDYRFLEVNPAFEQLTGLRGRDIVGHTVLEVLPGTERVWIERYGSVVASGEPLHFEDYSGELDRHYDVVAYRPEPGHFAVIISDVSERKRMERALRESEERYRLAIIAVKDGMWDWDMAADEVRWDAQCYTMLGYEPDASR